MKVRRHRGQIAALVAAVALTTACSNSGEALQSENPTVNVSAAPSEKPRSGGTMTMGVCPLGGGDLIVSNLVSGCGLMVMDAFNAGLFRISSGSDAPEPDIAESFETKDNMTFTVKLKKGYKFHDGSEVKARNFVNAGNSSHRLDPIFLLWPQGWGLRRILPI